MGWTQHWSMHMLVQIMATSKQNVVQTRQGRAPQWCCVSQMACTCCLSHWPSWWSYWVQFTQMQGSAIKTQYDSVWWSYWALIADPCICVNVFGLNSEDWIVLLVILFVAEIVFSLQIGDRLNRLAAALGEYIFCKSNKEEKQRNVETDCLWIQSLEISPSSLCVGLPTSGETLCRDNCQLIGMSLIGLARQVQKNCD